MVVEKRKLFVKVSKLEARWILGLQASDNNIKFSMNCLSIENKTWCFSENKFLTSKRQL